MGEQRQRTDMVDMTVAEDDKVDVRRAKAEKAKSADGGLVRAEGKKAAKARQAVPAGTVGVSAETLRVKNPKVLQAAVAPVTQPMPKTCLQTGTVCIARLLDPRWKTVAAAWKPDKAKCGDRAPDRERFRAAPAAEGRSLRP